MNIMMAYVSGIELYIIKSSDFETEKIDLLNNYELGFK